MAAENEERQRKEEELRKRLQEAQEASENGTIQLYKKMAMENAAREAEIAELRELLAKAEAELNGQIVKEKDDVIARLQKENQELKDKLASEKDFLQVKNCKDSSKIFFKNHFFREILMAITTMPTEESMNWQRSLQTISRQEQMLSRISLTRC